MNKKQTVTSKNAQDCGSAVERRVSRPPRWQAEETIDEFLSSLFPEYPDPWIVEDGDDGWAFWLQEEDTTSYLSAELKIQWLGSSWSC